MPGLFITGTDTGVGKTEFTAALARLWRRQGRRFRVVKPVATGGPDDAARLAEASGQPPDEVGPLCFPEPAAPPLAARLAGRELSLARLVEAVGPLDGVVLVEGVGGLLCPLTDAHTVADLAVTLGLPLVVVARRSLGTLNHTLLTVEAALSRRLDVAGVVVCETTPPATAAERDNVDELRRRLRVPVLAVVPHRAAGHAGEIPESAGLDWWSLAR